MAAARGLVPAGEPLWAQVAPGNAASMRSTLAAGFVPVGAEVLFAPRAAVEAGRRVGAMTDLVLTEHHDGGVALLRLNRPPMNPLSIALLGELRDAAPRSPADAAVKAVVVAGSEKALAAGADISELRDQAGARARRPTRSAPRSTRSRRSRVR